MSKESEVIQLKDEVKELKRTVSKLRESVSQLNARIGEPDHQAASPPKGAQYNVFADQRSCIDYDIGWQRLVGYVRHESAGLTAAELAMKWGKSRSRTSEVLNRLAEDGHVVKFRDGRKIRFRPPID
jgi:hypothetical protein